ncbi:MAG TPA: NAD-dependent epimerase/dehydratase family protein, partial [Actinomycetospora sp.]|nr:NAD-dependent epimerase/dehydratase family protein [Actinomycetospora sp.]
MRLLVLGGGGFLGFHVAAEALRAGHDVTVASRSGEAPLDGIMVGPRDPSDRFTWWPVRVARLETARDVLAWHRERGEP